MDKDSLQALLDSKVFSSFFYELLPSPKTATGPRKKDPDPERTPKS